MCVRYIIENFPKVTLQFWCACGIENLIGTKIIGLRDLMSCILVVDTICRVPTVGFVDVRVLPWSWN